MSSGSLSERERHVLRHIGRYRLTFKEIVSCLYFDGADPQKALNHLREEGYIEPRKGFGRNRSSYQLLPKGAAELGLSRRRAEALGSEATDSRLAILSFCFLTSRPRILLEKEELAELFDDHEPPGRYHCLERSTKAQRIYHMYLPGPTTRPETVVVSTREHVMEVLREPQLARWMFYRLYSHAVVVDTAARAAEIGRAFDKAFLVDQQPLRQAAHVHVECVPGHGRIEEALSALA